MDDGRYKGGGTAGGKLGCALSAIVGVPLLCMAILLSALGDCIPNEPCNHDIGWKLQLGALLIAAIVGLCSRLLINRLVARRHANGDAHSQ
jgi:hypothetical protein